MRTTRVDLDIAGSFERAVTSIKTPRQGGRHAVALHLTSVTRRPQPITLDDLRRRSEWHPPQTWHFFGRERLAKLVGGHESLAHLGSLI